MEKFEKKYKTMKINLKNSNILIFDQKEEIQNITNENNILVSNEKILNDKLFYFNF